ncbi:hypothetical protein IT072_11835 [Leifsonia sp. ZF2019]|uniref:hypothetical protein n=1 Tax=Leifsonia sp. ZF2019 TaxID=2781978 RepID=UPI001CBD66BB|nr:hypothetical protein [Leifsonia sp. ZF2019]UAJ77980.1 hypothetical protein IT072_11835 [Leifsonia sp. ZF2019]
MVITIEDDVQSLLELLWIREAWQLDPPGAELPPVLVDTPPAIGDALRRSAPIGAWADAWPRVWEQVLHHAGAPRDPGIFDRLQASADGSDERARLLHELVGTSWREEVGDDAITDDAQQWLHAQFERRAALLPAAFEAQPERVALEALIEAWRCGLTTIVEIPCRGTFARRIGPHAILITAESRGDPVRYRGALEAFC